MNNDSQKDVASENELLEMKLKESEQRYQTLIEDSPDMIAVHDGKTYIYVNPAGVRLLGARSQCDLIGKPIWRFIPEANRLMVKKRIKAVFEQQTKVGWNKEKFLRLDGKEIDVEVSAVPLQYKDTKYVQVFIRDIRDKLKVDELLLKSQKLSTLGELAAGIAHEIRNPLTSLRGFTQLLQASVDDDQKGYCEIMLSELDRINSIVSELLPVSKPQAKKRQMVYLDELVTQTVTLFESQANLLNVQIFKQFTEGIPAIYGESNQLKQVFINLIKNAIEAMPKGGKLSITLDSKGTDKIAIIFTDTGIGIPQSHLDRIGESFYTTKETGTGLGVMICSRIIENHSGNMMITSEAGKGTSIEVILPIKKQGSGEVVND